MEWPADFPYSPMDESLYGLLSSPLQSEAQRTVWTTEENDLFENALAEFSPSSPAFLESVATRVPWKSMEDIKSHYRALLNDIDLIETGKFPLPHYPDDKQDDQVNDQPEVDEGSTSNDPKQKSRRRRGVPWTEDEHQRFLIRLNKYGKGDWLRISRLCVITKTSTQVASHAQKYFHRQTISTPSDSPLPKFSSYDNLIQPQQLNHGMINSGGGYDSNAMLYSTMNNNNSSTTMSNLNPTMMNNMKFDPFFDQTVNVDFNGVNANENQGYPVPGYMMDPSTINQHYWGFH